MKKVSIIFLFIMLFPISMEAQCSMCRAVLESQTDTSSAEAINDGIVYLMIFPYLLMGALGYFIYRTLKKSKSQ